MDRNARPACVGMGGRHERNTHHAPRWQLTMAHRPAGEAVRALAWLGASKAEAALRTIKNKLPPEAFEELVSAGHLLPPWLAQSVSKLAARG